MASIYDEDVMRKMLDAKSFPSEKYTADEHANDAFVLGARMKLMSTSATRGLAELAHTVQQ